MKAFLLKIIFIIIITITFYIFFIKPKSSIFDEVKLPQPLYKIQ
ncbi:MAG: hypothetical protein KatS3mg094_159 [Candidatus Parcubacteria bacterium]|nr:MAG: hypothetical protein KatS3mg094_159 [Candidatus Parcubacteria bacterium]